MSEVDGVSFLKRLKQNYEFDEIDLVTAFDIFQVQLDNTNEKDRLAVIVHLIMLKENFAYNDRAILLELTQTKGSVYNKLNYNLIVIDEKHLSNFSMSSNLVVTLLKSGKCIEIHCKYKSFHSEFVKVNLGDLFVKKNDEHLRFDFDYLNRNFRINFVDKCLMGVKSCIKSENFEFFSQTRFFSNSLVDLPVEVLLFKIVLKYLNVKNVGRLMQTSKYFYDLLNADVSTEKSIWFYLLKRDFGTAAVNKATNFVDYKKSYFKNYKFYLI
jgi:hypothetical protein